MNCITPGCTNPKSSKSRKGYCSSCSRAARAKWIDTIRAQSEQRNARDLEYLQLTTRAHEAGHAAAESCRPRPMMVCTSDGRPIELVKEGPCGFAWVTVKPGNSPLANWLKRQRGASKDYYGGVSVWIGGYGQSLERKTAYAYAYAEVLRDAGYNAHARSRMD